jgi:hypothetical protein
LLGGCVTTGPRQLAPARFDYNQALAASWDQQLLLNLVRLRYRDTVIFLEVSSVISQLSIHGGAAASATFIPGVSDPLGLDAEIAVTETPTVSYTPLQGEEFVTSLLEPISPLTLMLLSQAGWSAERLLICCVARVNELENAQSAAGPTPRRRPRFERFKRMSGLLRELQVEGRVRLVIDRSGETPEVLMVFTEPEDEVHRALLEELGTLLGEPGIASGMDLKLGAPEVAQARGHVGVEGRSLLGVLFFLSQAVQVPEDDERAGRVTVTLDASGERFDWSELIGSLFEVRWSASPPANAFVRVPYRGHWFYIADDDLDAKTTFSLLTYLFALQSSSPGGRSPLLTVSSGGG